MDNTTNKRFTTALFKDKDSAEQAYQRTLKHGYKPEDVNVLMSEDSRNQYYDSPLIKDGENETKAVKGMGVGGAVGAAIGATLAAITAIGTALVIPGLGLVVAGPIAAGLAGAGVGSVSGGLIGALVGWGIPEEKAKQYEAGIKSGGVVLGVDESGKQTNLDQEWKSYRNDV